LAHPLYNFVRIRSCQAVLESPSLPAVTQVTGEHATNGNEHIPVLIVGGGVVGLSAALLLLQQDVPFVLVERHPSTTNLPRSRGLHTRSMEIFRSLGLETEIQAAGAAAIKQGHFGGARIGATLLSAVSLWETPRFAPSPQPVVNPSAFPGELPSPTGFCFCPQDELEPILLTAARQRGGDLRFNTELVSFTLDEVGVTATLVERATHNACVVRADYLIAADGARSPVRTALGLSTTSIGMPEYFLNIYFHADLSELVRERTFSQCQIENPEVRGLFISLNNTDRWTFHLSYAPEKGEKPEDFPPQRCIELIHKAIGQTTIPIEIQSIGPWEAAARVVDNFQHERIFLAGDAAHLMPPWGGFGANTGIADAQNLTWKLALVLLGQAASSLLTTYDLERRPVARVAAEQGYLRSVDIYTRFGIPTATNAEMLARQIDSASILSGYQYVSPAIIPEAADDRATFVPQKAIYDGQPGTRAPHAWVTHQGQRISTLDLFGRNFVLLTGREQAGWREAGRTVADKIGLELDVYTIGASGDLLDPNENWLYVYGITEQGAVLVRPDGFIAGRVKRSMPHAHEWLLAAAKSLVSSRVP
jgi:putative polyketide hydroxylase